MKKVINMMPFFISLLVLLGLSACNNYQDGQQVEPFVELPYYSDNSEEYESNDLDEEIFDECSNSTTSINTNGSYIRSVNQSNNILYLGFALKIDDNIYFADGVGIHKTDATFEHIETLMLNKNYQAAIRDNVAMFNSLQYHNGKIFFLSRVTETIYSMDLYGNDIAPVFSAADIDVGGRIFGFIVIDEKIYFYYNFERSTLMSLNTETGEVRDYNLNPSPMFSLSSDGSELHFVNNFSIAALNLSTSELRDMMPSNYRELYDRVGLTHILHRTISNNEIVFSTNSPELGGMLFVMDQQGYAREIYHDNNIRIAAEVNSLNEWIYFTATPLDDVNIHLYRIRIDGSCRELVFENLASREHGIPFIIFNILSEDLILFRPGSTFHYIYALIRNPNTLEMELKRIN